MSDAINPQHYKQGSIECIEAMEQILTPEEFRGYLKGNVFKYLWRERKKKGIEDLSKAKWYLDRLVRSFDDLLAEINAPILESEAPKPSRTQPPSGYRMLGDAKSEPRIEGDQYWSLAIKGWTVLTSHKVEYANSENWAACRKIEEPPKRYREPTIEDLKNGPIECEVGDNHEKRTLIYVFKGEPKDSRFVVVDETKTLCTERWATCRIEVQE